MKKPNQLKGKSFDVWDTTSNSHTLVFQSLRFGFLGGVINVLVDLDHFLYYWVGFKGWGLAGRPLHVPLAIVAGCIFVYCCARIGRLVGKQVLKK